MKRSILAALTLVSLTVLSPEAKDTSVAGTWTLTIEHFGVKLVLEETKGAVTGTLDWPHGDPIKLTGASAGDTLVCFGEGAGENFTVHLNSNGSRKADGTLAGTLKVHFDEYNDAHEIVRVRNQEIPWTARRGLHDVVHFGRKRTVIASGPYAQSGRRRHDLAPPCDRPRRAAWVWPDQRAVDRIERPDSER